MEKPVLLCGEGAQAVTPQVIEGYGNQVRIVGSPLPTRRPGVLAYLGFDRLKRGSTEDLVSLQPIYLRGPSITTPKRK